MGGKEERIGRMDHSKQRASFTVVQGPSSSPRLYPRPRFSTLSLSKERPSANIRRNLPYFVRGRAYMRFGKRAL